MDSDVGLFLGVYFTVLAMLILPLYIATALASGKLFERAGEKQWKAWVPFVSAYTRTKIVFGEDKAWWFLIDLLLGGLFSLYVAYNEARAFGREPLFAVLHIFFAPITTWVMWLSKDPYCGTQKFILDN